MANPHSTRHGYTGGTKPFPHCTGKMTVIAYLNHESPKKHFSALKGPQDLKSDQGHLLPHRGARNQEIPRLEIPKARGRQSWRFPARAQISQNFTVKTSPEGSERFDVGGSSVIGLGCGRQ